MLADMAEALTASQGDAQPRSAAPSSKQPVREDDHIHSAKSSTPLPCALCLAISDLKNLIFLYRGNTYIFVPMIGARARNTVVLIKLLIIRESFGLVWSLYLPLVLLSSCIALVGSWEGQIDG